MIARTLQLPIKAIVDGAELEIVAATKGAVTAQAPEREWKKLDAARAAAPAPRDMAPGQQKK